MTYEKIIKLEDGSSAMITVRLITSVWGTNPPKYTYWILHKKKRAKNWISPPANLGITEEQIFEAKMELWEKIKPNPLTK